tara:strand:- start:27 stop:3227 length:3201 start_codon:yes stop_codon:yes gene_type:complete
MSKRTHRFGTWHAALVLGFTSLSLSSCGGPSTANSGGTVTSNQLSLLEASNGFGQIVPHTIQALDSFGNVTPQIVNIRHHQDLVDHLRLFNQVRSTPKFPSEARLPSNAVGNHFMYASFSQDLDLASVLDPSPGAQANSGLTGAISVIALDPLTGASSPVIGRAFINGFTYAGPTTNTSPPLLTLQQWITADPTTGRPVALDPQGNGFPGTLSNFSGSNLLMGANTFVFVPDADGNLATPETFPVGKQIRLEVSTSLKSTSNAFLTERVLACSTVGDDFLTPEVITTPPPLSSPKITPGNGEINVDPLTNLKVEFTEPVQPLSVGVLDGRGAPGLSSLIKVQFGPSATRTDMPFLTRPVSIFDLSVYEIIPAFNFPGTGPLFNECNTFSVVDVTVNSGQLFDLARNPDPTNPGATIGNKNLLAALSTFTTGEGPGLVNTPVMPDAILVARAGAQPGISVIDLNGFGQSTGDPTFVQNSPVFGNSNYPNNPNVVFQTGLRPPLSVGTCTIDGGSAGVFTLTKDSSLNDLVVRAPLVASINDMMVGWALDGTFNNAQFPFGCQAQGGDICTLDGLKVIVPVTTGPNTVGPPQQNQFGGVNAGAPNFISWGPHPNPPPLVFPPLCVAPYLGTTEPTSVDHTLQGTLPLNNLLVPGDPFGSPLANPPVPPSGLLTQEQNGYFTGPTQGQQQLTACMTYQIRQQVGHYLYVLDTVRREIAVFNSNRMTIVDRIPVPDPVSLAIGSNLDFLAVTNQSADTVSFIDINPNSSTFHQIVKSTVVGRGPRGIAWQPGNEDILVTNETDDSLSIISAFSLEVRREVSAQLNEPFEVCIFPRQLNFAFNRGVYFAYILNRNGTVAMFESGPNGINGWGFDDVIGIAPTTFTNPKVIQPDPINLSASAWIVHEGPIVNGQAGPANVGAVSRLFIASATSNAQLLAAGLGQNPQFRAMALEVQVSIGEEKLSGVPEDIAFDNLRNYGGLPNIVSQFSAGAGSPQNGKGLVRVPGPAPVNVSESQFMFVAVPNATGGSGVIDVLEIGAAGIPLKDVNPFENGTQSIPSPNVSFVIDYWRQ